MRVLVVVVLAACSAPNNEITAYDTYQDCFDDRTFVHQDDVNTALLACCLDHPINRVMPSCGPDKAGCINFLTNNVSQTSASTVQIMQACEQYEMMK